MKIDIYTDGAVSKNGQENAPGGWAFIAIKDGVIIHQESQHADNTTNQRMELLAAIKATEFLSKTIEIVGFNEVNIYSDSAYLIRCKQDQWYNNWRANGWINSKKQPVANRDLWEQLIPYFDNPNINWIKVKGHQDNAYNNLVDSLAVAAKEQK